MIEILPPPASSQKKIGVGAMEAMVLILDLDLTAASVTTEEEGEGRLSAGLNIYTGDAADVFWPL